MEKLKEWFLFFINPLMNERGDIGDLEPDPEPEPGPDPEPEPEPEPEPSPDPEPDPEPEPEPELKIEDGYIIYPDGSKMPVDRFEKVYGKGKENERIVEELNEKHNLLKTNPEEYYRKFPDEKPAAEPTQEAIGNMTVQGGEYSGMTLDQVFEVNPAEANRLQFEYMNAQKEEATQAEANKARIEKESNQEIDDFSNARAQDFFKKDFSKLTEAEGKQISTLISNVLAWGKETGRGFARMDDMYFLMNKDTLLSDAKGKGIRALIDGQVKSVPSTAGGGPADTGQETGYAKLVSMSDEQLAVAIGNMSDEQYVKFKKEAPEELKKKHPGMPW